MSQFFFFFKQKTAYEWRISDWSSDVCSSDLVVTYTPASGYYGSDSFAYAATGPGGTSAPASVQLTVGTPPAPVAADKSGVSIAYGAATPIDLASSVTGVKSAIAVAAQPAHGRVAISG